MSRSSLGAACIIGFALLGCSTLPALRREEAPADLDRYDVVWNTPSLDASGSMPIGNGEVGLNVWVEAGGDLLFLIARSDSWSEASRLLKLGRIRMHFEPNPFAAGLAFEQRLVLREGRIKIAAGDVGRRLDLELFVDAERDVIHVSGRSEQPLQVSASLENWRNASRRLIGAELESSWTMKGAPASIEVNESADIDVDQAGAVVWYHRNEGSIVRLTLEHQGLASAAALVHDPLLQRTSGGWMAGSGFAKQGARTLATRKPQREFECKLAALSLQCEDVRTWIDTAREAWQASSRATARRATSEWWRDFWARSWIFVDGDPWPESKTT